MDNLNAFKKSLQFVLKHEGGYVNDPNDPGGETRWGISKRAYPNVDIANLDPDTAGNIYYNDYWLKAGCETLSFPFSGVVFDTAVNCGVSRASGWVGDYPDPKSYIENRKQYYIKLINKNDRMMKYLKGWLARLSDLSKFVAVNSQPL